MNELCNDRFVRACEVHHERVIIKEDIIPKLLCLSVYEDSLPVPATYIYVAHYHMMCAYVTRCGTIGYYVRCMRGDPVLSV